MRDQIAEILDLQGSWDSANTPPMQRRGIVVRDEFTSELADLSSALRRALGPKIEDLSFEGRDGTGRKTPIPWARFYSRVRSPSAQNGWYCVYLFHPDGTGVYLALAHGSTSFVNGSFQTRDAAQIASLVGWARSVIAPKVLFRADLTESIRIRDHRSKLGAAYEASTVLAKWYSSTALPSQAELEADAIYFASLLGDLYRAQDAGRTPGDVSPEVAAVAEAVEEIARPIRAARRSGQGRGLTAAERMLVEKRAMDVARQVLEATGYVVTDKSATESYDLLAEKGEQPTYVEVKGTTGGLGSVILTANEVELHRREAPSNALIVVHSIDLRRDHSPVVAEGGETHVVSPWVIDDTKLTPIAFTYSVGIN